MKHITAAQLAEELGMDPSNLLKTAKRLGIVADKKATPTSRGQLASVFTARQADKIRQSCSERRADIEPCKPGRMDRIEDILRQQVSLLHRIAIACGSQDPK